MSWQEFLLKFAENEGGLMTALVLIIALILWTGYLLLKKHVMPKISRVFEDMEKLQKAVDRLNFSVDNHKMETEMLKEQLSDFNETYKDRMKEVRDTLKNLKETVDDMAKFLNKIAAEHTVNHQERIRKSSKM